MLWTQGSESDLFCYSDLYRVFVENHMSRSPLTFQYYNIIGNLPFALMHMMAFSSSLALMRTRMDMGTAGTTWETRGTHMPRPSRKRWCMIARPHACGRISPSCPPGFRLTEPGTPHVHAIPPRLAPSPSPRAHMFAHDHRTRAGARVDARASQPTKGLRMASRHAMLMQCGQKCAPSCAQAPAARDASAPPSGRPEERAGAQSPRPRARRREADHDVLGPRAPSPVTTSICASIAPASHGQQAATRLSPRSNTRACSHCTQAGARDDTRTSQGHKGLRRASARPRNMPSSCLRPAFARQRPHDPRPPGTHPNRCLTLPSRRPGFEVRGRAPGRQQLILVFLGLVRLTRMLLQHRRLDCSCAFSN